MQTIPEFSLPATGGALFQSRKLQCKHLVLYFYLRTTRPAAPRKVRNFVITTLNLNSGIARSLVSRVTV